MNRIRVEMKEDMPYVGLYRGDVVDNCVSDGLNYYARGRNSNPAPGISSNYTTIPRYAAFEVK